MSAAKLDLLTSSLWETLYMVAVSGGLGALLGIPLGILLYTTKPGRMLQNHWLHRLLGIVINATRSVPFIILLVAIIPFTRWIVGTSIGTTAAIVPLTLGAIPFVARITEGALNEVPGGLIEAAQAMGATPWQIVRKVLLAEAMPGLIHGLTLMLITLIGYSAMAGAIGGGGLGDLGIRYGYQRFDSSMMISTVVILIVLVQLVQSLGDWLVRRYDHTRH
ncbi:methionine ABC transporter permease [Pokkaliibacter plantistimulans]|uniref:Methionine ABC transporter permease n=1 Tax=Pokkaliibacter plantistimulans TaxID=1635171 RepID=A0ABX5M3Q0_9GAMM|nr:methionine ABC transporter permease [Pokkaliibacter plantistimulans]PXF33014.1 methionine ABC transporter permease [Pokkaliibacter plantistimulans]